jgi:hypothetical protein
VSSYCSIHDSAQNRWVDVEQQQLQPARLLRANSVLVVVQVAVLVCRRDSRLELTERERVQNFESEGRGQKFFVVGFFFEGRRRAASCPLGFEHVPVESLVAAAADVRLAQFSPAA